MPDDWLGGSRRNVLRNILVDERGREVNYGQGVGGGAGYNQHDAYGFHGAGRIFSLTPQMCLRVRVRLFLFYFFSRIALRKDQGGIWQNKSKGTERNGMEGQGVSPWSFFSLFHSIPHCHSHFTWYFFM